MLRRACRRDDRGCRDGLRDLLDGLTYPLYFADFETLNRAIPPFAGMRPYDHLPFNGQSMCSDKRAQSQSTTSFLPQVAAILGASS